MKKDKFDVIVVGAGPAGSSAALTAAQKGARVLLIERGEYVGAKNMTGGMLLARVLDDLVPEYWKEAPLERPIKQQRVMMCSKGRNMQLVIGNDGFVEEPTYNGFSVLRGDFDPWLAGKAQEAGAVLVCKTVVDDLLKDEAGQVVGVRCRRDGGDIYGDVVILADGANSLLALKAGLRRPYGKSDMGVGVKELIAMDAADIEARFGLDRGQGASYAVIGDFARGISGGGFIYTNKDSISIGMVAHPHCLVEQQVTPYEVLEAFKAVPEVARLIRGGRTIEYSGHLIGESGLSAMPKLYAPGVLVAGDAAGFVINTGLVLAGMNLAIASGRCAGLAAASAVKAADFGEGKLSDYAKYLDNSVALSAMKAHAKAPDFMKSPRLYDQYPDIINDVLEDMVVMGSGKRDKTMTSAKSRLKGIRKRDLLRDVMKAGGSL